MRIGLGFDIHPLVFNRPLILCGITIPHPQGLQGHSDADAGLHAVADAILGALGKGDIGEFFPDTDGKLKGINSRIILEKAKSLMTENGYSLENMDIILFAKEPKLSPYREEMRKKVSEIMGCSVDRVNIKAKSGNGLGEIGEGKAISAQVAVLLEKNR